MRMLGLTKFGIGLTILAIFAAVFSVPVYAQPMGTVDDPLPTDALKQPFRAQIDRLNLLLDHGRLVTAEYGRTRVVVDWGDGRVHDFPDGDNGVTWLLTNSRGNGENRVTIGFLADVVVADTEPPVFGDGGLVTGIVGDELWLPAYLFAAVGGRGAANFGVFALSIDQPDPLPQNPLHLNWLPLGYGLAEPIETADGITYEPIVYDYTLVDWIDVGDLLTVIGATAFSEVGVDVTEIFVEVNQWSAAISR